VRHDAVARGDALDPRSVYFWARLSPRYPTVEVRVADTCSTVEDTVAYAGLVRALVATGLVRPTPPDPPPEHPDVPPKAHPHSNLHTPSPPQCRRASG
jgi:glutamate---cysteine ligase / carboxylate-amine ligase